MIVVGLRGTESHAEDEVVAELSSWTGEHSLPGVALIQPWMATQGNNSLPDALVLTPQAAFTLEVKGLTHSHAGGLRTPVNGRWTTAGPDGTEVDLLPDGARDINPLGQANRHSKGWRAYLHKEVGLPGAWVKSVIVISQPQKAPHEVFLLDADGRGVAHPDPHGPDVLIHRRFRKGMPFKGWVGRQYGRQVWDVLAITQLFEHMQLEGFDEVSPEALLAEGFEADAEERSVRHRSSRWSRSVRPDGRSADRSTTSSPTVKTDVVIPVAPDTRSAHELPVPTAPVVEPQPVPPTQAPVVPPPSPPYHRPGGRRRLPIPAKLLVAVAVVAALTVMTPLAWARWQEDRQAEIAGSRIVPPGATTTATTRWFQSPSGNITCRAQAHQVRCDISKVAYEMKSIPPQCRTTPNWGHVFVVDARGGRATCPDSRMSARGKKGLMVLKVGQRLRVGPASCSSAPTGITCRRDGGGFRTARSSYQVWTE